MPFTRAPNCATAPRLYTCAQARNRKSLQRQVCNLTRPVFVSQETVEEAQSPNQCSLDARRKRSKDHASVKKGYGRRSLDEHSMRVLEHRKLRRWTGFQKVRVASVGCGLKKIVLPSLDKLRGESYHDARPALTESGQGFFFDCRQARRSIGSKQWPI